MQPFFIFAFGIFGTIGGIWLGIVGCDVLNERGFGLGLLRYPMTLLGFLLVILSPLGMVLGILMWGCGLLG